MTEAVFAADPARLLIAAATGIVLLLLLIIKFKIHPVLSLLISALVIGLGAGMPVPTLVNTVEKGAGETLQGIVLLIGLGSLFGGILEVSGGAQCVAQTLINRFGEKKAGIALGITGLIVGTTVFFEAGVVILIPLAFGLAKRTKKSTLYYVIPLLAGLAAHARAEGLPRHPGDSGAAPGRGRDHRRRLALHAGEHRARLPGKRSSHARRHLRLGAAARAAQAAYMAAGADYGALQPCAAGTSCR